MSVSLDQFFCTLFHRQELGISYLPWIEVRTIAPKWYSTAQRVKQYWCRNASEAVELVDALKRNPEPYNLYFGVLPRVQKSGLRGDVKLAATLWTDIDEPDFDWSTLLEPGSHLPPPSIIVATGNGVHCYWLVRQLCLDIARIERLNNAVRAYTNGDKTFDASRVLRIPGTKNYKAPGIHPQCDIVHFDPTKVYILDDFSLLPQTASDSLSTSLHKNVSSYPSSLSEVSFSLSNVDYLHRRYIEYGIDADIYNYYQGDKSRLDFAVIIYLLKQGYGHDEIYSIFTDPSFGISQKTLEKPYRARLSYISKTIQKAERYV